MFSIQNLLILDLRDSNFGSLIGFKDDVYRDTWGSKLPNINNYVDNLYVHCRKASNSLVDGGYSDVIFVVDTTSPTHGYPFSAEPFRVGYDKMNRTIINSINIRITEPES